MTDPLREAIESLRPNDGQWEAFHTEGHCVVIAPPGSGKTHLLSTRIAFDLQQEIPQPHGAACVTLTNPAAAELRDRVGRFNLDWRSTVFTGTVHSLALTQIVRPFATLASMQAIANSSIATSREIDASFKQAIGEIYRAGEDTYNVQSTIEFYRKRMVPHEDWRNAERLVQVAERQRQLMRQADRTDFDEIIASAVQMVETLPIVRAALVSRFPRVYVDEYQDLAPGLDRLIRSICFDQANASLLFAVGDPDQAIFGWTGSRAELLLDLSRVPGVTTVPLLHNYRCGSEIIRAANKLRPSPPSAPRGDDGGTIEAHRVSGSIDGQADAAADMALELVAAGTPLHEIAVICATNVQCNDVSSILRGRGISHFVRSDLYRLTATTSLLEQLAAWVAYDREASGYRLGEILRRWRRVMNDASSFSDEVELVQILLQSDAAETASGFCRRIVETGLRAAIRDGEDRNELDKMMTVLVEGDLSSATILDLGSRARRQDRLEITTMPSSKGLEFDAVLIVGADQQNIPHYMSLKNNGAGVGEDRRKFYVSITRARKTVHIYYSGYVLTKYDRRIDAGPSQFLVEMGLA